MTINKCIIAALLAAPATLAFAGSAQAQVSGIATANPVVAMGNSKAFGTANQQIATTFKSSLDQVDGKEKSRQQLLSQLDKNGDKNVDDGELQAAATAKSPVLTQIQSVEAEMVKLNEPAIRAQAFAIEGMTQRYDAALRKVVADKKISVVLTPESFVYAPAGADVTQAITAEIDRAGGAIPTAVPANWQPNRQTLALQQQLQQYQQYQVARAVAQQRAQQGAAPAAGAPAKPATTKPAEPR